MCSHYCMVGADLTVMNDTDYREKARRVRIRKTKIVTFRITTDEYERLRIFCISKGQRSVSDLARLAVSTVLENGGAPTVESRLAEVEGRVHFLTRELLRLSGNSLLPAGAQPS